MPAYSKKNGSKITSIIKQAKEYGSYETVKVYVYNELLTNVVELNH